MPCVGLSCLLLVLWLCAGPQMSTMQASLKSTQQKLQDVEEEYNNLQEKHRDHLAKEHELGLTKQRLELAVENLENELGAAQSAAERERAHTRAAMEEELVRCAAAAATACLPRHLTTVCSRPSLVPGYAPRAAAY